MAEYRLFFLKPGQKGPEDSTCVELSCGGIMWIGPDGTAPKTASLGARLERDVATDSNYNSRLATTEEIKEYEDILAITEHI